MREDINELVELVKETDVLIDSVTVDTPKENRNSIVTRIAGNFCGIETLMRLCSINDINTIRKITA